MLEKIEALEQKQKELLSQVLKDERVEWLDHACTKALLLQYEIDSIAVDLGWRGRSEVEHLKAQRLAEYIETLPNIIGDIADDES